jgi:hypothetical protein
MDNPQKEVSSDSKKAELENHSIKLRTGGPSFVKGRFSGAIVGSQPDFKPNQAPKARFFSDCFQQVTHFPPI